ncbi:MAG: hypothetical protein PHG95_01875 [Patescibacteria group bacterium]|nr:hypothetical protein [Patescibacteria group bacterium]
MDNADYKKILLNSYLSISDSVAGLKEISYAKLIFFVLFLENREINIKELKTALISYTDIKNVSDEALVNGTTLLKSKGLIQIVDDKFYIITSERKKAEEQIKRSSEISSEILKKHFPRQISEKVLEAWFNDVNEKYFSSFADKLIEIYNKNGCLVLDAKEIINPIIDKFKLSSYRDDLLQGYNEFLLSKDKEEEEKIWNIMQSLLAARIITADISPDFLSLEKYNNSEIIIDTNILFAINSLAGGNGSDDSISSLGKIAKKIGAKFFITEETIEEYDVVCKRKKEEFILMWKNFPIEILRKASNKDPFFRSLISLGCENEEDVNRFFDSIEKIPTEINGSKINILKHNIDYDKQKDQVLYNEIRKAWAERHNNKDGKSDRVAIHDLIITKICRKYGLEKKIFALTLDLSLEALSLKWVNDKEDPIWRSLYSLVQVLAINGGGPDFNPNDMAPLVKIFIEQEDSDCGNDFDKRDLLRLSELSDKVRDLPNTTIISLLNRVHRANMLATGDPQSIKDIKLELDRSLVKTTSELSEKIAEKDKKIETLEEKLNITESKSIKIEKENILIKKIFWFSIRTIFKFGVSFLLFYILGNALFSQYNKDGITYEVLQNLVFIFSPAFFIFKDYVNTFKQN